MSTTFVCPNGHRVTTPGTLTNVTIINSAGRHVGVTCPTCGVDFDAAPGGGTYSTVGGEWRKVADWVRSADTDELRRLRDDLARARAESSEALAREALAKAGLTNYERRMELWQLLTVLLGVIAIVLTLRQQGNQPTAPEINNIINQCIVDNGSPRRTVGLPPRAVGRNDLCPCGSGKKYKRCHDAPTSIPRRPSR